MVDQDSRGSAFSGDCDIAYALLVAGRAKHSPIHIEWNEGRPLDVFSRRTLPNSCKSLQQSAGSMTSISSERCRSQLHLLSTASTRCGTCRGSPGPGRN